MSDRARASDLEQIARSAVEMALARGVDEADAWCEERIERTIRVYGGEVENLTEAGGRGVGLRVFRAGRTGYAYGSEVGEAGLRGQAHAADEAAAVTEPDEHAGLPADAGAAAIDGLASPSFSGWSTERKVDLALAVERAARSRDSLISNIEDTIYADGELRVALANSHGFRSSYEQTQSYAYAYAFAGEGADLMTGVGLGIGRGPEALDPEAIGREAADRALALHGARRTESRRCPVLLDPFVAASFLSVIGGRLAADAVQRGRSLFAGKLNEQVAAPSLRLVDDGLDPDGLASAPFDGEGVAQGRTVLIENGTLETYLFDSYTARRAGRASTGNAARSSYRAQPSVGTTNLVVAAGERTTAQLIEEVGEGVYVASVSGLHAGVNGVSGVFSVGASGRRIVGGELGEPIREFTIASDLASMLRDLRAVGAETRWVPFGGSVKAAPLLIGEMTIAGA